MDIAAGIALVVSIVGITISVLNARSSARTDEVSTLTDIIHALQGRVDALEIEVQKWQRRYKALCDWVRGKGLDPDEAELMQFEDEGG